MVSRFFDIPASTNDLLVQESKRTNVPQVNIVRDALKARLQPEETRPSIVDEVRQAVQEAIGSSGGLSVGLNEQERARLEQYSKAIGTDPKSFAEESLRLILGMPIEEIRQFLQIRGKMNEIQSVLDVERKKKPAKRSGKAA